MLNSRYRQWGLTLIELMIAGTIGAIALAAVVTVYSTTAAHSTRQLQNSHLYQQMNSQLHYMVDELRRAGYRHFDPDHENPLLNPFHTAENRLRAGAGRDEAANSCILYAYDLDQDGLVGSGACGASGCRPGTDQDNVEQFGFRLRRGQLQSRYGGRSFRCDTGNWQAVSDPDIEIVTLEFLADIDCLNLAAPAAPCEPDTPALFSRSVDIRLQGRLRNRPDTVLSLNQPVHIRNDRLED